MDYPVTGGKFIIDATKQATRETTFVAVNKATSIQKIARAAEPAMKRGAQIKIAFQADNTQYNQMVNQLAPGASNQTARVSLVQICQDNVVVTLGAGGVLQQANVGYNLVQVADGTADDGTRIDQDFFDGNKLVNTDPRYAQHRRDDDRSTLVTQDLRVNRVSGGGKADCAGWAGLRTGNSFSLAMLFDEPGSTVRTGATPDTAAGDMQFEIAVLFEATGKTPAFWGGSISWGYHIDLATGAAVVDPIQAIPGGGISARFQKAINVWNNAQVTDPVTHAPVSLLPLP